MPIPSTTMLNLILSGLGRRLPQAPEPASIHACFNEDSSWHRSSFELAHGLEVIEHRGQQPPMSGDTMPAHDPPRA